MRVNVSCMYMYVAIPIYVLDERRTYLNPLDACRIGVNHLHDRFEKTKPLTHVPGMSA